jgi:cytoskeleton protein RodZ
MRQKIDIADVEAATKIRAKYLRALENEEFGLLPGNTFVKTFLRTYAEYLGLDPQLLLEEYRAGYEPRNEAELQPYSVSARRRAREPRARPQVPAGPPGPGTALIVIVGVVLVIFAILGLTSGGGGGGSSKSAQKKTPARPAHRPARPKVTSVRLRVVPTVATYICVDHGPGTPIAYQRTTARPVTFKAKRVRINAGNSLVRMSANGRRVRIPRGSQAIGWDFKVRRGRLSHRPIPLGQRPCA